MTQQTGTPAQTSEDYLRGRYGAYRGHPEWRALEEAFNAGRLSAQAQPVQAEPFAYYYEHRHGDCAPQLSFTRWNASMGENLVETLLYESLNHLPQPTKENTE